jgi:hypothetical protein
MARRQEEKTLKTHIRDGVETLVTKVKDAFHKNEDFYKVEKPLTQTGEVTLISPALQSVYEEWQHPAFANATAIHQAFEKGLKIHGEEKAIAYWESRKPKLLQNYQKDLDKIEKELGSSLLKNRSDQWKNQARELAKQDPGRILNLIQNLKDDVPKQENTVPLKPSFPMPQVDPTEVKYVKFKALHSVVENNPNHHSSTQEELKQLGKELFQDKNFMEKIKLREQDEAQKIERIVQEKQRSFDRGRGGLSL